MNQPAVCSAESVAEKLPLEHEHFEALNRMRLLDPYYRWTLRRFGKFVGRRVMDAGCGIGNFTEVLASVVEFVLAVDLSPENIRVLNERFRGQSNVEVAQLDLDRDIATLQNHRLDTIVCLDVLEHIEDDVALLKSFHKAIQPGGHLLVKVPACKFLFGPIDVASSHYRRYTPSELREKAVQAGWNVVKTGYMNIWGVAPYYLKSRVQKKQSNFSRTFAPWQLNLIRSVIPLLEFGDKLVGPPVGQSAILIARRDQ